MVQKPATLLADGIGATEIHFRPVVRIASRDVPHCSILQVFKTKAVFLVPVVLCIFYRFLLVLFAEAYKLGLDIH